MIFLHQSVTTFITQNSSIDLNKKFELQDACFITIIVFITTGKYCELPTIPYAQWGYHQYDYIFERDRLSVT